MFDQLWYKQLYIFTHNLLEVVFSGYNAIQKTEVL